MADVDLFIMKLDTLVESKETTYKELERDLNFGNGYFGKLKKRGTLPTVGKIDAIARFFNVSRDYFLRTESPTGSGIKIPLLGKVAAGIPIEATENIIGEEEIPGKLASTGEFFALLIKGDSMSPDIQDGDKVIVQQQSDVESGQIAIVLINGDDATCKEIKKMDNSLMLISRNPNYAPMVFTSDEVINKPVQIIGRVIEIRRTL